MPRIGVRDHSGDGSGSDVTGNTSPLRGGPHATIAPARTRGGGDSKASKGEQDGDGKNDADGGSGSGGGGEGERRAKDSGGRGRRTKRKDGAAAARRRKGSRSERFFEMSATTQVRENEPDRASLKVFRQIPECSPSVGFCLSALLVKIMIHTLRRPSRVLSLLICARPVPPSPLHALNLASAKPPLVDTLDLQAGVCVQEGGDERKGPAFEEVGEKLENSCLAPSLHSKQFHEQVKRDQPLQYM